MAVTSSNTDVVRSAVEAINRHDTTALREHWLDDVQVRFPTRECHGPAEVAAYFQEGFDAMPDLRLEILGTAEEGENVMMRWRMTGTHTGASWEGIAASGRRVELDGMDHFVIRDGKVATNFVVFDQVQFGRAVGMMPADGSPGDKAMKAAFAARVKLAAKLRR